MKIRSTSPPDKFCKALLILDYYPGDNSVWKLADQSGLTHISIIT
jgi:hypothetical protein